MPEAAGNNGRKRGRRDRTAALLIQQRPRRNAALSSILDPNAPRAGCWSVNGYATQHQPDEQAGQAAGEFADAADEHGGKGELCRDAEPCSGQHDTAFLYAQLAGNTVSGAAHHLGDGFKDDRLGDRDGVAQKPAEQPNFQAWPKPAEKAPAAADQQPIALPIKRHDPLVELVGIVERPWPGRPIHPASDDMSEPGDRPPSL